MIITHGPVFDFRIPIVAICEYKHLRIKIFDFKYLSNTDSVFCDSIVEDTYFYVLRFYPLKL